MSIISQNKIERIDRAPDLSLELIKILTQDECSTIIKNINPQANKYKGRKDQISAAFLSDMVNHGISKSKLVQIMNDINVSFNLNINDNLSRINTLNGTNPSSTIGTTSLVSPPGLTRPISNDSIPTGTSSPPGPSNISGTSDQTGASGTPNDDSNQIDDIKDDSKTPGGTPAILKIKQNEYGLNHIASNIGIITRELHNIKKDAADTKSYLIDNTNQQKQIFNSIIHDHVSDLSNKLISLENIQIKFMSKTQKAMDLLVNLNNKNKHTTSNDLIVHKKDIIDISDSKDEEEINNEQHEDVTQSQSNKENNDISHLSHVEKYKKLFEENNNNIKSNDMNRNMNAENTRKFLDEPEDIIGQVLCIQNAKIINSEINESENNILKICSKSGVNVNLLKITKNDKFIFKHADWKNYLYCTLRFNSNENRDIGVVLLTDYVKNYGTKGSILSNYKIYKYRNYDDRIQYYENRNNKFKNRESRENKIRHHQNNNTGGNNDNNTNNNPFIQQKSNNNNTNQHDLHEQFIKQKNSIQNQIHNQQNLNQNQFNLQHLLAQQQLFNNQYAYMNPFQFGAGFNGIPFGINTNTTNLPMNQLPTNNNNTQSNNNKSKQ